MRFEISGAVRFAIVGIVVSAISLGVHHVVFSATSSPWLATMLRLVIALPMLYVGYSRWVLGGVLRDERAALGPGPAGLRMVGRVLASVGASTASKMVIEPILAVALLNALDSGGPAIAVLLGDFGYGPVVNYVVLALLSPRKAPEEKGE